MVRRQAWLAWLAGGVALLLSTGASGIYLDEAQNITLRARIYSQFSVRSEDSQVFTFPDTFTGQLVQNRNFFNPEVDAKLTSYMNWMNGTWADFMSPDDFRFRIAAWGFYDGVYDYGSAQFDRQQAELNSTFNPRVPGMTPRTNGWYARGASIKLPKTPTSATTFGQVFPGFSEMVPRDIYAHQARVNELYLSYSKGPFFLRFGRQSISWGESDTVALLDQQVWGQGFEPPLFCDEVQVLQQRLVADRHLKLKLRCAGEPREAIWFDRVEPLPERVTLAYRLALDEWNGRQRVQMMIQAVQG